MKQDFLVVCYYTDDELYRETVKGIKADLDKLNLIYHLEMIPVIGDWKRCAKYRATFLLQMLERFKCPLLSIDADARMYSFPDLFNHLSDYDIAYHYFRNRETFLGTFYVNNNEKVMKLLKEWEQRCVIEKPRSGLIFNSMKRNVKEYHLPPEYAKIFDLMRCVKNPVIEHFQISRKARRRYEKS